MCDFSDQGPLKYLSPVSKRTDVCDSHARIPANNQWENCVRDTRLVALILMGPLNSLARLCLAGTLSCVGVPALLWCLDKAEVRYDEQSR